MMIYYPLLAAARGGRMIEINSGERTALLRFIET